MGHRVQLGWGPRRSTGLGDSPGGSRVTVGCRAQVKRGGPGSNVLATERIGG